MHRILSLHYDFVKGVASIITLGKAKGMRLCFVMVKEKIARAKRLFALNV